MSEHATSGARSDDARTERSTGRTAVLVVALVLTGLSMRTAVTSVGAALDDIQDGLHVSGGLAGLLTTLPVLCFAGFGSLTPKISGAVGPQRLLTIALTVTTVGLVLRPTVATSGAFIGISVLALAGAAVSNVLMPSLVKGHFPDRIGTMTALYTTALAVGTTAGAGLTLPLGDAVSDTDGWRYGLGFWAVLTALAVLPWLSTLREARRLRARAAQQTRRTGEGLPVRTLLRSKVAWSLTIFFGTQSMQAYISFGWFERFLTDHDVSAGTAGAMVALFAAMAIPVSALAPRVPPRRQRLVILGFSACTIIAYLGLAIAPVDGAWAWMVIAGIGGGSFPMALTLIGQRARTEASTASLSAFVQSIGYLIAGTGPLLFGALFGATGHWAAPLAVLFVAAAITTVATWPITVVRYVDDDAVPASA